MAALLPSVLSRGSAKAMLMFSAIFFDLDDTLCDDAGASQRAVALACRRLRDSGAAVDVTALATAYITAATALWTVDPLQLAGPVRRMRRQAWGTALAATGVDGALVDQVVDLYAHARRETYTLFPESLPLLRRLRAQGIHLGLITNGPADLQREKITMMGLACEVDQLRIAGEEGVSKPDPAIFHRALHAAAIAPDRALMIGDSWEKDILAARAVGMAALWISSTSPTIRAAEPCVRHIREVADWLAATR